MILIVDLDNVDEWQVTSMDKDVEKMCAQGSWEAYEFDGERFTRWNEKEFEEVKLHQ